MQYVQTNHNIFQNPMKENTPHSKKKKNSPSKKQVVEHVVGKRKNEVMGINTPTNDAKGGNKAIGDSNFGSYEFFYHPYLRNN